PAPLLAGAGPAMDPQTAQAPSLQPAPLATSYPASRERANIVPPAPQTAAFRPARRLMPAGSFLAWNRGALRTAAPAASGVAPAEAQASAHVAAPMAALLARAAERCDHCRGALPADRLPDLSMLTGQQRQPVPSGLLALVGECDGQFLYSVTNRTGSEMSFELRDANTGEGWDISHLRPGETRNIRSSVHLKLP
ncbi:MAG: hypothetical protein NTX64_07255, partial [Elusimicrobia bacterium]|nr:hypothetical protein [Elusimicrobiota bacterium]